MMRRRHLPPMNALRGFEAAARHMSFTIAGDELHLTQGAVSRQVKELELYLGQRLFERMTRQIALTPSGLQLFQVVGAMLDDLESVTRSLTRQSSKAVLTISALPTISALWLMPRLPEFASAHQDVEIKVLSSTEPADLLANEADVAIRVGPLPGRHYDRDQPRITKIMLKSWEGAHADELFPDKLVPVCSPRLISQPITAADELTNYPLIHLTTRRSAWPDWLKAHQVHWNGTLARDLQLGHFFLSIDAARQGRGIALIPEILLKQDECLRNLMIPYPPDILSAGEYYLLVHQSRLDNPHVTQFREWVLAKARES